MAPVLSSPHVARINRVDRVMLDVLTALVPGVLALTWFFGAGVLINAVLAAAVAITAEAAVLAARRRPVLATLRDLSAVVTAVLFACAIPPTLPWWLTVVGMVFAIVLVKQLYGGLGYNPFNPAMAAYVLLVVSYPVEMTNWLAPHMIAAHPLSFMESLRVIFLGEAPAGLTWDAISAATPLEDLRTQLGLGHRVAEIRGGPLWGVLAGRGWEWINGAFLAGGLYLVWRRTITWRIPVSMLGALCILAGVFWLFDPQAYPAPIIHLLSGATMLGAFFIATDPVTASTTPRGQLFFGAGIGALVFVIRTWGGYPDAVAFAVLLLNIAAPTIDHYTEPRVFGHQK
jgi:Na+-translocating ferredoxin:NAD+ oxidoreductase subunit D